MPITHSTSFIDNVTVLNAAVFNADHLIADLIPDSAGDHHVGSATKEWLDLFIADSGILYFGNDQEVTLTHVADVGLLLNAAMRFEFRDSGVYISSKNDGYLDLDADTGIRLNGAITAGGNIAFGTNQISFPNFNIREASHYFIIRDGTTERLTINSGGGFDFKGGGIGGVGGLSVVGTIYRTSASDYDFAKFTNTDTGGKSTWFSSIAASGFLIYTGNAGDSATLRMQIGWGAAQGSAGITMYEPLTLSGVGLNVGSNLIMPNNVAIQWKDSGGTARTLLNFDGSNQFVVGSSSYPTYIEGNTVYLPTTYLLGNVYPNAADTYNLGHDTMEFLNLYIGDAGKIFIGLGQDLSIHRSAANTMTLTASSGVILSAGLTVSSGAITATANHLLLTSPSGYNVALQPVGGGIAGIYDGAYKLYYTQGVSLVTITTPLTITDTTDSTTKDTGALILEGGLGVEKNVSVGVDLNVDHINELTATHGLLLDALVTVKDGGITLADLTSTNAMFNPISGGIDFGIHLDLKLDEGTGVTVYDSGQYRNDGAITSATWVVGRYGECLNFSGDTQYVNLGKDPSLDIGAYGTDMTISVWIYPTIAQNGYIICKRDAASGALTKWDILFTSTQKIQIHGATAALAVTGSATVPLNVWTLVTCTWSGTTGTIYLNGALDATGTLNAIGTDPDIYVLLGCRWGTYPATAVYFAGKIDNPRIWARVLNAEEIKADYQTCNGVYSSSFIVSNKFSIFTSALAESLRVTSTGMLIDHIDEITSAHGVVIDGVTIKDADVTATSFTIGANVLTTTEFAFLDAQDQAVKKASDVQFRNLVVQSLSHVPYLQISGATASTWGRILIGDNDPVSGHWWEMNVDTTTSNFEIKYDNVLKFHIVDTTGDVVFTGGLTAVAVYSVVVGGTNRDLYIDNSGVIGYVSSSIRYKENIVYIDDANWLYGLQPVTFDRKDGSRLGEWGLIAEDVAKAAPSFVSYDDDGMPETVSYGCLISPIIVEIKNLKTRVDNLNARIATLEKLKRRYNDR